MKKLTDKRGFIALFGRYVFGFNPWTHCDHCLKSRTATDITPGMIDDVYPLMDHMFYLCGVGQKISGRYRPEEWQRQTNVHLAVRPRKGSVVAIGSVYGVTFVIEDAQAVPIIRRDVLLAAGSEPVPDAHLNCKMFQFGYQMFEAEPISYKKGEPEKDGEFTRLLREESLAMLGLKTTDRIVADPGLESSSRRRIVPAKTTTEILASPE